MAYRCCVTSGQAHEQETAGRQLLPPSSSSTKRDRHALWLDTFASRDAILEVADVGQGEGELRLGAKWLALQHRPVQRYAVLSESSYEEVLVRAHPHKQSA